MASSNSNGEVAPTPEGLALLVAAADQQYAKKNYANAAELYSEATALQSELRGEMDPNNAGLLYTYGRCLYHVAVSASDILGGRVVEKDLAIAADASSGKKRKREESGEPAAGDAESTKKLKHDDSKINNKPYFQLDRNGLDSSEDESSDEDGEESGAAGPGGEADEEDDFATAYEILDLARILFRQQMTAAEASDEGNKDKVLASIKERLADTHDLQAEISLENERFPDAVKDSRAALELKIALLPFESAIVAEAHFKLSLALEFAYASANGGNTVADAARAAGMVLGGSHGDEATTVDATMRKEAADHMSSAIASTKARVAKERATLADISAETERNKKLASIADVEDILQDMQSRVRGHASILLPACNHANLKRYLAEGSMCSAHLSLERHKRNDKRRRASISPGGSNERPHQPDSKDQQAQTRSAG